MEGLRLWQGFGLGGLTSPFTVLSSMGSPSMMATSANGRESRLFRVEAVIPDLRNFDSYIKAKKKAGVCPRLLSLSTPLNENKTKHSINKPSHSQSVSGICANPRTHPTSSVMDHPLLHISRFPRSCRGEKWMVVVEGKNRVWNVPGGPGIKSQPSSSGNVGSIPGGRTEIPHALKKVSSMLQVLSP